MEKLENKLKIGMDNRGRVEVLKGHEGEVFESVVFRSYKNKKGVETFKSSSPDRKIIILSPFSEIPQEGKSYRVLIIEDTDPGNSMDGKMVGTMVSGEQQNQDPRSLAIKIRNEYKNKENEDKLTPEDRKRLAGLVKQFVDYRADEDFYEDEYSADHYDDYYDERGERFDDDKIKAIEEKKRTEWRNQANRVISLRRQLREEGSRVVSFILELCHTKKPDRTKLHNYSKILYFAASEKDAKKVLEFYSLASVAKDTERTVKSGITDLMSRIGTAKDVELMINFLDEVFKTDYGYNSNTMRGYDAYLVLKTLSEIKEKTDNPRDLEAIDNAIKLVGTRVEKTIGYIPNISEPSGPEEIKEDFEEKFMDVELRQGIDEFVDYLDYYPEGADGINQNDLDDNDVRIDLEATVSKLKDLLNKYNASDKMPMLMNKAYWTLINKEFRGVPGTSGAISRIKELTGIAPDYHAMEPQIQLEYREKLLGHPYEEDIDFIRKLYSMTAIKFKVGPTDIQEKYLDIVLGEQEYPEEFMETITEVTGIQPNFRLVEKRIQREYEAIILNAESYEDRFIYGSRGLNKAEHIYKTTGIRPEIDEINMKERYVYWLRYSNQAIKMITVAESITGIKPDFGGYEHVIQSKYDEILYNLHNAIGLGFDRELVENLKRISGIEPAFDPERVMELYISMVRGQNYEGIKSIYELTGIAPDFKKHEELINRIYLSNLTSYYDYSFDSVIERMKDIQEATGVKLNLSQEQIGRVFNYAVVKLRGMYKLHKIFRLEEILPGPDLMIKIFDEILADAIDNEDEGAFNILRERIKKSEIAFSADNVVGLVSRQLLDNPRKVLNTVRFLKGMPQDNDLAFLIYKTFSHNPWVAALIKLEKIQGMVANAANDPWANQFRPFIQDIVARGVISLKNGEDAEAVVSFIEMMGMNNLPQLFDVYIDCHRHKKPGDLSGATIDLCEEFGIRTRRKDGSWRFKSSLELFNELSKALKGIQTELLADRIPDGLTTDLGSELFKRLKGSSQFENAGEKDDVPNVIRQWARTVKRTPSLAELPPGFKEATFRVPLLRQQKVETARDQSEEINKLLASQEVGDVYLPLAQAWEVAIKYDIDRWFGILISKVSDEETNVRDLLAKSPEEFERMIANETDPKAKQGLIKKSKALQNPKGRQGIERQADMLREAAKEIDNIQKRFSDNPKPKDLESLYADALEDLNRLDGKIPLGREIRELSAMHMFDTVMAKGQMDLLDELFYDTDDGNVPTTDRIYGVHKIAKDYVEEHYLHHLQNKEHTEHTPFSPELLEKLNIVWQQQLDQKTGYLPITILKKKIDKILGVENENSQRDVAVTMVPVSGLFNVFSGDLGDSCHLHKREEIAGGGYPNLKTWVYVSNRGKPNEELKGSVLAIQAEATGSEAKTPVLIVRGNNPVENFIQTLDSDNFTIEVLKKAVETAKRMRTERINNNPSLSTAEMRQIVAIPMDMRGRASTNRQPINDVYRRRFKKNKALGLRRTSETEFNGYILWDKSKALEPESVWSLSVYSVAVWEIDENGNETWHGDWE
ncbi:MAG: hypothetical protein HYT62_00840 [Candidatus Yanofskybacteria bacterium]|nr:hypothetical protein [Candidatus Yanofskybacteria bacterium]